MSFGIKQQLLIRKKEYEAYERVIAQNRKKEPDGNIKISHLNNGYLEYYHVIPGQKLKYISRKNTELISGLLQKRYDTKVSAAIWKQLKAIDDFLNKFDDSVIKKMYSNSNRLEKEFIKFYEYPDSEYAGIWENKKYQGNPYPVPNDSYVTKKEKMSGRKARFLLQMHYMIQVFHIDMNVRLLHPEDTLFIRIL